MAQANPQLKRSANQRLKDLSDDGVVPQAVVALADEIARMVRQTDTIVKGGSAARLASHYVRVKTYKDQLDEISKALSIERDRLAYELIPRAFSDEGTTTLTLKEGYRVTLVPFVRASIKEGQREEAYGWLRQMGHAELITNTINSSTLSAFVKNLLSENQDVPEGVFNVNVGQNTSVTKVAK